MDYRERFRRPYDDPKAPREAFGLIYFLRAPEVGRVKIGYTGMDRGRRVRDLRWANAAITEPIAYLRGTTEVEDAVQRLFAADCHHGEWFTLTGEIEAFAADFATAWPEDEHPASIEIRPAAARMVVARTRLAIGWWRDRGACPRPVSRIDWSRGLPHAKRWEEAILDALDARRPRTPEEIRQEAEQERLEARAREIAAIVAEENARHARCGRRSPWIEMAEACRADMARRKAEDARKPPIQTVV